MGTSTVARAAGSNALAWNWIKSTRYQLLAVLICLIFGVLIILNVQMSGEATWFWYATLLHRGVKLYGDMHLPLQPLYTLETDGWMLLFGRTVIAYEILALLHVVLLCAGMLLLLRESRWADWQKAIVLVSVFFVTIRFNAYRFDDFHVVADIFGVCALVLLLWLARAVDARRELVISGSLGVLCGLSVMNRITDGGLLLMASGACVAILARRRRIMSLLVFAGGGLLAFLLIFGLTGDSFSAYVSNSILRAAGAKGGNQTIFHAPFVALDDSLHRSRIAGKGLLLWTGMMVTAGWAVWRYWKKREAVVAATELLLALIGFAWASHATRTQLLDAAYMGVLSTLLQPITYVLCAIVAMRFLHSRLRPGSTAWDARESLILIPLATLLSAAASQANGTSNNTATMATLMLIAPVVLGGSRRTLWLTTSFVVIAALVGVTGMTYKVRTPYSWNALDTNAMFVGRKWYRHPVYGPMYADRDLLNFFQPICSTIREGSTGQVELLSLPYSYANYFCDIPPWNGYVQTWFDTSTGQTIAQLMHQLDAKPPKWVLYERQLRVLRAHETEYFHGQPIAHRALDEMIMEKISSGQWKLVKRQDYLAGDGWFLIETHPG